MFDESLGIRDVRPWRRVRAYRAYGPTIVQQLHGKLAKTTKDEDCWTLFFAACRYAKGASAKTVSRWRQVTEARIAELARERLDRPRIILPSEAPRRLHVPGGRHA